MNIREIAQLAGVSISTVSKVLNRKDQAISEETRRKVLAVMKENHYQPYVVSRFYGSSHSFLIGAVLCKRPGIERFLETLMEAAAQQGYSVLARFAQSPKRKKRRWRSCGATLWMGWCSAAGWNLKRSRI